MKGRTAGEYWESGESNKRDLANEQQREMATGLWEQNDSKRRQLNNPVDASNKREEADVQQWNNSS